MGEIRITRSNYTIKKEAQRTANEVLNERDFMTLSNLGNWEGTTIPYGESNFKIITGRRNLGRREHKYSDYLPSPCPPNESGDPYAWTLECELDEDVTDESKIRIKPNQHSLLEFAYYGSAAELVKASIRDIITKFPGEIYISDYHLETGIEELDSMFIVENPFGINISRNVPYGDDLKYFYYSYDKYEIIDVDGEKFPIKMVDYPFITPTPSHCYKDGEPLMTIKIDDIELGYYFYGGNVYLLYGGDESYVGVHIRPKKQYIDEFFNSLDDFERVLLNRDTDPLYMCSLDTPKDTETGIIVMRKSYVWPVNDGWNLDIESGRYANYLNSLLDIAEFYDEAYSNNLWNALTHDSIKNMDHTFSNPSRNEDNDDYKLGATKIQGFLWACGRFFDDFKRYIENIKHTNNVTYDGSNNLPDYFLSDTNELAGWDVYSVTEGLDGLTKEEMSTINTTFLRNLKINSKEILSHKGTRYGIDMLLGLFGLRSYDFVSNYDEEMPYDFKIDEYVTTFNPDLNRIRDIERVKNVNMMKKSFPIETDTDEDSIVNDDINAIDGLPVRIVTVSDGDKYLIPWFDKTVDYDGNMYFHMFGGWGAHLNNKNKTVFDETQNYLYYVKEMSDLPRYDAKDGEIYYVINKEQDENGVWKDGFVIYDGINYEWNDIEEEDYRIVHLKEDVIDEIKANNPHVGYSKYDGGEKYWEYFKNLFQYSIENDTKNNRMFTEEAYDCTTGNLTTEVLDAGIIYDIAEEIDNNKVWFFFDNVDNKIKKASIDYVISDNIITVDGFYKFEV